MDLGQLDLTSQDDYFLDEVDGKDSIIPDIVMVDSSSIGSSTLDYRLQLKSMIMNPVSNLQNHGYGINSLH